MRFVDTLPTLAWLETQILVDSVDILRAVKRNDEPIVEVKAKRLDGVTGNRFAGRRGYFTAATKSVCKGPLVFAIN